MFCSHSVWPLAQTVTHADIGPVAVLSFFMVSGFLITLTLEANYTRSVWRFVTNRFLRIYPTLWVSMLVAVAIILSMGTTYVSANFYIRGWTWDNILRCILIVPAYGDNSTWGPIPVGWSLQVELCFYLVIAALYFVVGRLPDRTRHILTLLFWSVALLVHLVVLETMNLPWSNALMFVPFFVVGVATALFSRIDESQRTMRWRAGAVLVAAIILCGNFIRVFPIVPGYLAGTLVTLPALWGLFFILLLPSVASRMTRLKSLDTLLGNLTYPLYALHFPLNQAISFWLYGYLGPPTVFVQLTVSLVASYALWKYLDQPLSTLRSRVRSTTDAMPLAWGPGAEAVKA